jgi:hypothetical protein
MSRRRMSTLTWIGLGLAAGVAIGIVAWSTYQDRHAHSLFSPKPRRRLAALSRLSSPDGPEATVDTVATLREYVAWERHPLLKRRGKELLARLASSLT